MNANKRHLLTVINAKYYIISVLVNAYNYINNY